MPGAAKIAPEKAAKLQADLAKTALSGEALKEAGESAREKEETEADESSESETSQAEASDAPPSCKGQEHHIISRPIAQAPIHSRGRSPSTERDAGSMQAVSSRRGTLVQRMDPQDI